MKPKKYRAVSSFTNEVVEGYPFITSIVLTDEGKRVDSWSMALAEPNYHRIVTMGFGSTIFKTDIVPIIYTTLEEIEE